MSTCEVKRAGVPESRSLGSEARSADVGTSREAMLPAAASRSFAELPAGVCPLPVRSQVPTISQLSTQYIQSSRSPPASQGVLQVFQVRSSEVTQMESALTVLARPCAKQFQVRGATAPAYSSGRPADRLAGSGLIARTQLERLSQVEGRKAGFLPPVMRKD